MTATSAKTKDDIFGVCRRLGEDFGFHPNILRVALAIGLIWSIEGVFAAYLMLAAIVLVSRVVAPVTRAAIAEGAASKIAATDGQDIAPAPAYRQAA